MKQNLVQVIFFILVEVDNNGGTRVEESLVSLSRILLKLYDVLSTQNQHMVSFYFGTCCQSIYDYAMGTWEQKLNKSLPMSTYYIQTIICEE